MVINKTTEKNGEKIVQKTDACKAEGCVDLCRWLCQGARYTLENLPLGLAGPPTFLVDSEQGTTTLTGILHQNREGRCS